MQVASCLKNATHEIEQALLCISQSAGEDTLHLWRERTGKVLGTLYLEMIAPLVAEHKHVSWFDEDTTGEMGTREKGPRDNNEQITPK